VECIVRILPQAIIALVVILLLSIGALFIGTNAEREGDKWKPAIICTTGTTPVRCVGD
jgi:hypothetical protein